MIGKQGKNFTTAKIFKKVCKMLFVNSNYIIAQFSAYNCCIKIMVDRLHVKFWRTFTWRRWYFTPFLRLSVDVFQFKYLTHCYFARLTWRYVITSTSKRHRHYHIWQTVQRCILCPLISDAPWRDKHAPKYFQLIYNAQCFLSFSKSTFAQGFVSGAGKQNKKRAKHTICVTIAGEALE